MEVTADSVEIGIEVFDSDGDKGTVVECDDPHNILVEYGNCSQGFFCLVDGCDQRDVLYIKKSTHERYKI